VIKVRKVFVLILIFLFASTTLAFAAWKIVDLVKGDGEAPPGQETIAAAGAGEASPSGEAGAEVTDGDGTAAAGDVTAADMPSGEDFAYTDPDQRYVSETQRHQNFFIALAEGRVKRLDAVATDYQPVGDANTSYLYFTLTTTDGAKHDGTMVLKFEGGLWRIAAIRQLEGDLGGGTNYVVPAEFEADLAREISELQEFLTKVAEGRLDYMIWDSISHPSDTETVLTGRVVGIGGRIQNTQMTLRKDYNVWHLTNIVAL
jgi:hypothetical protein